MIRRQALTDYTRSDRMRLRIALWLVKLTIRVHKWSDTTMGMRLREIVRHYEP